MLLFIIARLFQSSSFHLKLSRWIRAECSVEFKFWQTKEMPVALYLRPNSLRFKLRPSILFLQRTCQSGVDCVSPRRLICIGQTNTVVATSVYPSLYIWNNEIWKFVLLQSLFFAVKSNNTCFRWFVVRWFDYWYTVHILV